MVLYNFSRYVLTAHQMDPDVRSFSSALTRTTNVSVPKHLGGRALTSVKGAPETIKRLLASIPDGYDETCKWLTRHGSRVLALRSKDVDAMSNDRIVHLAREQVGSNLRFASFLVFHCPLKEDAVETLKGMADSSHRVRVTTIK